MQIFKDLLCVLEGTGVIPHIANRVRFDILVKSPLLQDIQQLSVRGIRANRVDYWEREFALGEILAESLVFGILLCGSWSASYQRTASPGGGRYLV